MSQQDLTLAGVGGQGSILAGVILGSAGVTSVSYTHLTLPTTPYV